MTSQEREQMNRLCTRMQVEQDQEKFLRLCQALNKLLDRTQNPRFDRRQIEPNFGLRR